MGLASSDAILSRYYLAEELAPTASHDVLIQLVVRSFDGGYDAPENDRLDLPLERVPTPEEEGIVEDEPTIGDLALIIDHLKKKSPSRKWPGHDRIIEANADNSADGSEPEIADQIIEDFEIGIGELQERERLRRQLIIHDVFSHIFGRDLNEGFSEEPDSNSN